MERIDRFKKFADDAKNKTLEIKDKSVSFVKGIYEKIKADKTKRIIATVIITAFILFLGVGTVMYYIAGPAVGYMTSDSTDSLEWAEEYRITGELISQEYNYAAILPFGGNQIFLPFLSMFGYSVEAQIGGLLVFAILFCAATVYLGRGLGLGWFSSAGLSTFVMLLMSSSPKLREIMWEHIFYYNLGILFFCFGFGLAFRIIRDADKIANDRKTLIMTTVRVCVLAVFCTLASTDGLQALVCFTLPLVAGIALYFMFKKDTPIFSKANAGSYTVIAGVGIFSLLGMKLTPYFTGGVEASYANSYSAYSNISDVPSNFLKQIPNWLTLFGVDYMAGDMLDTAESVGNMLKIAVATLLFIIPIVQLVRYKSIKSEALKLLLLGHTAVMAFILFACTFGNIGNANWRLTPLLGTCCIVTFVSLIDFLKNKGVLKRIGVALVACTLLGCYVSFNTIWDMPSNYGEDNSWHALADELEARGLKYGYATFWWANLTKMVMGDGAQVACIDINKNGTIREGHYQSRKDAYGEKDTDRYFVIFNENEYPNISNWINLQKSRGNYVEEFVVESSEYDFRGYKGTKAYVIVVNKNPF